MQRSHKNVCSSLPSTSVLRAEARDDVTISSASSSTSIPNLAQGELASSSLQCGCSNNSDCSLAYAKMPPSSPAAARVKQVHKYHQQVQDEKIDQDYDEFSEKPKTAGLKESDYYAKGYGAGGSTGIHQRNCGNIDDTVRDMTTGAIEAMQILEHENKDVNDAFIEYLPQTAALLLSALQDSKSTTLGKKLHKNNDDDNNNDERGTKTNTVSLFENLLLSPPEASDTIDAKSGEVVELVLPSGFESNNPPKEQVTVEQMEAIEREADALYDSIMSMENLYSQRLSPKSTERKDHVRGGTTAADSGHGNRVETRTFLNNDIGDSDDEDSIQGDIARLSRSITHLKQDLESTDFSFLNDLFNEEIGVGDMSGNCWSDKLRGLKMWLSRNSIVEQKMLHAIVPTSLSHNIAERHADYNLLICSILLKVALLVVLIPLLLRILSFIDMGNSIDDQGRLADIADWLFQR